MPSSSSDEDFSLAENTFSRTQCSEQGQQGIHPVNRVRKLYGEYHHSFQSLKQHEEHFFIM
nr:unnamed protein product [Callosobruchus chinensis]